MAKNLRINKTTKTKGETPKQLVVQELNVLSANRSSTDVGGAKSALQAAENVFYPNRTRLYDLYANILLDGHLTGIIGKRIAAVLNKKLHYERKGKRDDEMSKLSRTKAFRKIVKNIILNELWGTTGMDFIPGDKLNFVDIPRKHVKPEFGIISFDSNGTQGIQYRGVSNLWILGDKPEGAIYDMDDLGLLLKCSFYAIWKRGTIGDWAQYIEIFGQPVRVIYYDAYDDEVRIELKRVLDESGSSLALMVPNQAKFEMHDGKQSNGDGKLQESFKTAMDNEMSVIILGNTETTTSSTKSGYAQSKEHGKQQLEVTKSDLVLVENELNSDEFRAILKSYGYSVEDGEWVFEKEIDLEFLKDKKEIDIAISEKVPIDDEYWYSTYGIPKPDNYDELKAKQEAEKAAQQNQFVQTSNDPEQEPEEEVKPKKPAPKKKPLKHNLSDVEVDTFWRRLRTKLADFFDPAPWK